MKQIIWALALTLASTAAHSELVVEAAGEQTATVPDIVLTCEKHGFFVYDTKLFMCTKIRETVTMEELNAYQKKAAKRKMERWGRRR